MRKERGLKILYLLLALFFACSFFSYAPEEQENPLVTETENASFRLVVPQGISFQVRCEDSTSTTQIDESLRLAGSSRNLSLLRTVIFFYHPGFEYSVESHFD